MRRSTVTAVGVCALVAGVSLSCSSSDNSEGETGATTSTVAATTVPETVAASEPASVPETGSVAATSGGPGTGTINVAGSSSFPAGVSANGRYLVDQNGDPFMMVGDSPQCLSANLSPADMEFFFANRQGHGFNTMWVNLLCGLYTRGRGDATTYDGIKPFLTDGDVSTPNPEYFARMDTMVDLAASHGLTLLLDPAETGSFKELLMDNGVDKTRAYGEFLGKRYFDAPNIIWMLGNDYQNEDWETFDTYELALAEGIRNADPNKLQTVELNYFMSTSYDDINWPPVIDLASAYSYFPTYDVVLRAYNSKPVQPVFMVEANYEFENNTKGPETTDETLRRQEYWTMLSGATGQLYGNGYTWGLETDQWKEHFDTPAVTQLTLMATLFGDRRWYDLVPDQDHSFLVDGFGDYSTGSDVLESDYATAAITPDGTLGMVYVPTDRTLTVDLTKMKPGSAAQWFDPTNGSLSPATEPFTTPGANAAGDHDWVLLLEAPE
jgi:Protein of unknown function (DUF4038)/Putative collagen-binding domain of a collagenase